MVRTSMVRSQVDCLLWVLERRMSDEERQLKIEQDIQALAELIYDIYVDKKASCCKDDL